MSQMRRSCRHLGSISREQIFNSIKHTESETVRVLLVQQLVLAFNGLRQDILAKCFYAKFQSECSPLLSVTECQIPAHLTNCPIFQGEA